MARMRYLRMCGLMTTKMTADNVFVRFKN